MSSSLHNSMSVFAKAAFLIVMFLVLGAGAFAQSMGQGIMSPPANVRPPGSKNVGIEQHLNQQVPLELSFRDETGKPVRLADYFGKKPVILSLVYYRCPMLCSEVLAGMEGSFKALTFDVGKEFDVVTVSFDPTDTPESATEKKASVLKHYKRAGAAQGWHFLTGSKESIEALTRSVGFDYDYDPKTGQFAHTTAIMVLTPEGKIAQYYFGVEFPPRDIRLGLVQASEGKIGNLADQVVLYCYHYDPQTGKYGAIVSRILQLAGGATIVLLGTALLIMFRRGPDSQIKGDIGSHQYVR